MWTFFYSWIFSGHFFGHKAKYFVMFVTGSSEYCVFTGYCSDEVILNNALDLDKGSSDIQSALKYFNSITEYMMQLRTALGELRDDIE